MRVKSENGDDEAGEFTRADFEKARVELNGNCKRRKVNGLSRGRSRAVGRWEEFES